MLFQSLTKQSQITIIRKERNVVNGCGVWTIDAVNKMLAKLMGAAVETNKKRRLYDPITGQEINNHSLNPRVKNGRSLLWSISFWKVQSIFVQKSLRRTVIGESWRCKKLIKAQKYPQGIHFLTMQLLWKVVVCEIDTTIALKN